MLQQDNKKRKNGPKTKKEEQSITIFLLSPSTNQIIFLLSTRPSQMIQYNSISLIPRLNKRDR